MRVERFTIVDVVKGRERKFCQNYVGQTTQERIVRRFEKTRGAQKILTQRMQARLPQQKYNIAPTITT